MARPRNDSEHLSIAQLEALLGARRSKLGKLERQRSKIERRLAAIDARIAAAGGQPGRGGKSGRAHNKRSLPDTIAHVLAGKSAGMKVGDLVDAVLATGYHTNSDNFRGIVNQALIKDKRFHALTRGIYAARK